MAAFMVTSATFHVCKLHPHPFLAIAAPPAEPAFSSKRAESVPIDPPGTNGNAKPGPSPVKLASAAHEETQSLMFGDTEENSKMSSTPQQDGSE